MALAFVMSGAFLLATPSFADNSLSAIPHQEPTAATPPTTDTTSAPAQHRGPVRHIVPPPAHPQPIVPASAPVVSSPVVSAPVSAPAVSAPAVSAPAPPSERIQSLHIDPAERQVIVTRNAEEMQRQHCLRKLEARQRALRTQNRGR